MRKIIEYFSVFIITFLLLLLSFFILILDEKPAIILIAFVNICLFIFFKKLTEERR